MTAPLREPGTYRTTAGTLVHFRPNPDGTLVLDLEDEHTNSKVGGELLVKLSDDPYWPDVQPRFSDPELFAD